MVGYVDLFDIEQRPGAGVGMWSTVVERQLERVRDVNYRHRLHHSPSDSEQEDHPEAESELHAEVYFLVLAIRRLLLFAEALASQVDDDRLQRARERFDQVAPNAKQVRNFFEHIDEYLLDTPSKHMRQISGRAAPILISRWDCDNVVVAYGPDRYDVTLAANAAIEFGQLALKVWDDELERLKQREPKLDLPTEDDGIPRAVEMDFGVSTVIEGSEGEPDVRTGCLLGIRLREISTKEASRLRGQEDGAAETRG